MGIILVKGPLRPHRGKREVFPQLAKFSFLPDGALRSSPQPFHWNDNATMSRQLSGLVVAENASQRRFCHS